MPQKATATAIETQSIGDLNRYLNSDKVKGHFRSMIPKTFSKYLTPERITKIVINAASRTPQLLVPEARTTLIRSIADLVAHGLEPGGPLGQAYLVPRKNKGSWEVIPVIGYRGYLALLRRSGMYRSVAANIVYANDEFSINLADEECPSHVPYLHGDRGANVGAYCVAQFKDGGIHKDFMNLGQLEKVRDVSPAARNGPWVSHFDEMCRKTVIRRASKYWPLSVDEADAISIDGDSRIIDQVFDDVPPQAQSKTDSVLAEIVTNQKISEGDRQEALQPKSNGAPKVHEIVGALNSAATIEQLARVDAMADQLPEGPSRDGILTRLDEKRMQLSESAK